MAIIEKLTLVVHTARDNADGSTESEEVRDFHVGDSIKFELLNDTAGTLVTTRTEGTVTHDPVRRVIGPRSHITVETEDPIWDASIHRGGFGTFTKHACGIRYRGDEGPPTLRTLTLPSVRGDSKDYSTINEHTPRTLNTTTTRTVLTPAATMPSPIPVTLTVETKADLDIREQQILDMTEGREEYEYWRTMYEV